MIIVMLHMPAEGEAAERMIQAFKQRNREVDQMPGFRGFELLHDYALRFARGLRALVQLAIYAVVAD